MRDRMQLYTPYSYLQASKQNDKEIYNLFLLIPVKRNRTIRFLDAETHPASTIIQCEIVKGTDNTIVINNKNYAKKHYQFVHSTKADKAFNPRNHEVTIVVKDHTASSIPSTKQTLFYKDSDTAPLLSLEENIAWQSPYVYLSQPEENLSPYRHSFPKLLIPINEYNYRKNNEKILITSEWNGIFETDIMLFKGKRKIKRMISPAKTNKEKFVDIGIVEGNFSVTITLLDKEEQVATFKNNATTLDNGIATTYARNGGSTRKKRARVRSKSANTTPATGIFIDQAVAVL